MSIIHEQLMQSTERSDKFCIQCEEFRSSDAGVRIVVADKMLQRWICSRCKEHHPEFLSEDNFAVLK